MRLRLAATDNNGPLRAGVDDIRFEPIGANANARIALPAPPESKEPMIGRPYSFVNPPSAQPHEFYFITLPEGPLHRDAELVHREALGQVVEGIGFRRARRRSTAADRQATR